MVGISEETLWGFVLYRVENPAFNMVSLYSTGTAPPSSAMLPSSVSFAYNGAAGTLIYPAAAAAPNTPNGLPMLPGPSPQQPVPPPPQFWTDPNALAAWTPQASAPGVGGTNRPAAVALPLSNHVFNANASAVAGPFPALDVEVGRRLFQSTGYSPFVDLPKDITAKEYMRGCVMRKWVMESHGKKTSLGKRGWKAFYARLRDLVLYLYKDADTAAAATRAEEMHLAYLQQVYRVYYHYQQQQHQQMQLRYQQERYQQHLQQQQQQQQLQQRQQQSSEAVEASAMNKRPNCLPLDSFPAEETVLDSCNANTAASLSSVPVLINGSANTASATSPVDATELDEAAVKELDVEIPNSAQPGAPTTPKTSVVTPFSCAPNSTTFATTTVAVAAAKPNKPDAATETNAELVASATPQSQPLQPVNSYVFTVPPPPPTPPPPEAVICIAHAFASTADDYTKKQHVFRLRTKDGAEFLFQVK
ncbi:unnamed protein product [Schistocephalus solidus]|uniref:PH domain-containing protein n=1 Tax=Schistocephalus solidus TaxID=70667 RepID=A0A183T0W6_SCHSO|nr:unnamed protein product [Schistocephalus solidus]